MMIMRSPVLGEFAGTFMLLLLGNGVNAAVTLKRSKAEGGGWPLIAVGWALAVLCGIFTAMLFGSADGHLNPAITLAFAIENHQYSKVLPFFAAQLAGAFCGAAGVWIFYFQHWRITEDAAAKRGVFCTGPAIRNYPANLFSEAMATFALVLVAGAMSSKLVLSTGAASGLSPWLISCLIWSVGLSPRRHDRLRHQPRARPGPAPRPRPVAHRRQDELRLELCLGAGHWSAAGSHGRRMLLHWLHA